MPTSLSRLETILSIFASSEAIVFATINAVHPPEIAISPELWTKIMLYIIGLGITFVIVLIAVYVHQRQLKKPIKRGVPIGAVIVVGILLVPALFFVELGPPSVTITTPSNNGTVQWTAFVEGTSQHVPQGSAIWIFLTPLTVDRYYPQSTHVDVLANGRWSTTATFGETNRTDIGLKFKISAVLANSAAQSEIQNYLDTCAKGSCPGMTSLPNGAQIYDSVVVTKVAS
jgi:hypothetical protein